MIGTSLDYSAYLQRLQSELARDMAMCGKVDLKAIDKSMVKVHKW